MVVQNLVNKAGEGSSVSVHDAIVALKHAGWKSRLTTYEQERKHIYEVFRQARRDGLSSIRVDGDDIYVEDDDMEVVNDISRMKRAELESDMIAARLHLVTSLGSWTTGRCPVSPDVSDAVLAAQSFKRHVFHRFEVAIDAQVREEMLQEELESAFNVLVAQASGQLKHDLDAIKSSVVTYRVKPKFIELAPSPSRSGATSKKCVLSLDVELFVKCLDINVDTSVTMYGDR